MLLEVLYVVQREGINFDRKGEIQYLFWNREREREYVKRENEIPVRGRHDIREWDREGRPVGAIEEDESLIF